MSIKETAIKSFHPGKVQLFLHLIALGLIIFSCLSLLITEGDWKNSLFMCLVGLIYAWLFCTPAIFPGQEYVKITTEGIIIAEIFSDPLLLPWDKIVGFDIERCATGITGTISFGKIKAGRRIKITFIDGYKPNTISTENWFPNYFPENKAIVEELNNYLSQYKSIK